MTTDDVKAADRADRARANGYRTRMRAERDPCGAHELLPLASASLAAASAEPLSRARTTPVAITVQPLKSCQRQKSPVRLGQLRIWKRRLSIRAHPNQLSAPPKIVGDSALGGACR
jgi:hypothetical protein